MKNTPSLPHDNRSLGQVATEFIITLPSEERLRAQQEIYKFVRWYGERRSISGLSAPEVANYAEQVASSTSEVAEKLGIIKTFLAYAYKQGLTKTNLSTHLKIKKTVAKSLSHPKPYYHRKVLLTSQGYAALQAELDSLKNERLRVTEELQKAAADKDFRENAPLDAAREYQGQLEARIRELEATLKMATLVTTKQETSDQKITFGDTVVLRDMASGERLNYTLVDAREANPLKGMISVASPVGQALLGRTKGQRIEVKAPAGILYYHIEDVRHR